MGGLYEWGFGWEVDLDRWGVSCELIAIELPFGGLPIKSIICIGILADGIESSFQRRRMGSQGGGV
jgi:hypothetical protein